MLDWEKVKEIRSEKRKSQRDVAGVIGISQAAYNMYERGVRSISYNSQDLSESEFVDRLGRALGLDPMEYPIIKQGTLTEVFKNISSLGLNAYSECERLIIHLLNHLKLQLKEEMGIRGEIDSDNLTIKHVIGLFSLLEKSNFSFYDRYTGERVFYAPPQSKQHGTKHNLWEQSFVSLFVSLIDVVSENIFSSDEKCKEIIFHRDEDGHFLTRFGYNTKTISFKYSEGMVSFKLSSEKYEITRRSNGYVVNGRLLSSLDSFLMQLLQPVIKFLNPIYSKRLPLRDTAEDCLSLIFSEDSKCYERLFYLLLSGIDYQTKEFSRERGKRLFLESERTIGKLKVRDEFVYKNFYIDEELYEHFKGEHPHLYYSGNLISTKYSFMYGARKMSLEKALSYMYLQEKLI